MKKVSKVLIFFSFLFFLLIPCKQNLFAQEKEKSTVNIENARKTSYYTDKASGDEIIIFSGGVSVSVKQGDTTTKISAENVNFNRTKNILYAEGAVTLDRTSSDQTETMTADSVLLDVNTQEGIFNDGRVIQANSETMNMPSGSTMIVASDLFGKDNSGAITFKRGNLTFCDDPNPHWKIKASRIWLLPGNEFAFANALLFVGHVPVMYFPFFYYPKEELVFNPVFGYKQREGYFVQTTTYLIGRKPLDNSEDDDSFMSFMKPSKLKKQKLEGLVLRNLDEDDKESYPNTLKLMADYYTNLGGMIGIDGQFQPEDSKINTFNIAANIGLSRTLFRTQQNGMIIHLPYDSKGNTYYNKSDFLGLKLPFRYKGNFEFSISDPFSFKISMPLYSDPYFNDDFLKDRKESMDWIDMLLSSSEEDDDDDDNEITSFSWNLTSSYSPKIEKAKPYINRISFSPSASMIFSAKADTSDLTSEEITTSPSRKFFYPSQIKPFAITMSTSGNIISFPKEKKTTKKDSVKIPKLNVPAEFSETTAEEKNSTEESKVSESETENTEEITTETETTEEEQFTLPLLQTKSPTTTSIKGFTYNLSYDISPTLTTEISYDAPATRYDFEWDNLKSTYYKFTSPTKLKSTLGYRDSFISMSNNIDFSPSIQRHPEYRTESGRETAIKNDYASQKMDLTNTNSISFKPFIYSPILKNTSLSWNSGIKLIQTEFIGTVETPEWEYELPEWDDDSFSAHTLNFAFAAEQGDFSQKLTLSTNLPPKVDQYNGTLSLGFPFITTSVSAGIKQKSIEDTDWELVPLNHNSSLKLLDGKFTVNNSFKYDLEEKTASAYNLSVNLYNFTVSYSMLYTNKYEYNDTLGWKSIAEKEFQPVSLNLKYSKSINNFKFLGEKVKFSPSISTALYYDMQRPTNSYFSFAPTISFEINEFLTLSFSSSSMNKVIYRYIQDYTDFEPKIPGETNIFKDLANSFAFADKKKRESSGFKIKSLDIKLSHELHDWKLNSEFELEPRMITKDGRKQYDFSPYFTISVLWKPMESIKTTIEDEYGEFHLNP